MKKEHDTNSESFPLPGRKRQKRFWVIVGICVFIFLLPLFSYVFFLLKESEEDAIKKQFYKGEKAVEKSDLPVISQVLSSSYNGTIGKNKNEAVEIAKKILEQLENLHIKPLTVEAELNAENTARLHSNFEYSGFWVGSQVYNRAPLSGGVPRDVPGEVTLDFVKEENQWLIIHMELILNGTRYD